MSPERTVPNLWISACISVIYRVMEAWSLSEWILQAVHSLTGNDLPYGVHEGCPVHLPHSFNALDLTGRNLRFRGAFSAGPPYDLLVIGDIEDLPSWAEMHPAGKVVLLCPGEMVEQQVRAAHRSRLFWVEWKRMGDLSLVLFRKERFFSCAEWDGGVCDSLLVHFEWGWGDAIQDLRFLPWIKDRIRGDLFVESRHGMEGLVSRFSCIDKAFTKGEPLPPTGSHIEMSAVHRHFDEIPGTPYLGAETIRSRSRLKIAVTHVGHHLSFNQFRYIDADDYASLHREGCDFILIQKHTQPCRSTLPDFLVPFGEPLDDWFVTARAISGVDIVISPDTAIAHLAGAMGKKVFVTMPHRRYRTPLLDRDLSIWYPTMEIFSQELGEPWTRVLNRIRDRIGKEIASQHADD